MSNFAKAQLLKFGWTEGKGLGKNENGIVEALKPKLKFDTSGVGHKDIEFEWWDSVYDKALKNIVLENKPAEVSIKVAKENAFNISSTKNGLEVSKKKHSLHYGKFLKTSTLMDGNLIKDNSYQPMEEDTSNIQNIVKMSDEDLFKACGGRTAHKGARHGLTLNGKLARIAEQEKQLIAAGYLKTKVENSDKTETKLKRKKKKKKDMEIEEYTSGQETKIVEEDDDRIIPPLIQPENDYTPSKETCKKNRRRMSDLSHQLTKSCLIEEEIKVRKKCKTKKKESKRKRDQNDTNYDMKLYSDILMEPSTKKLKKHKNLSEPSTFTVEQSDQAEIVKTHKKCKKEKGHHKSKDHKLEYCTRTEAERLNYKIKRKKDKSLKRKEEKKYSKLSESLLAVSLDAGSTDNIVTIKSRSSKKLHKRNKVKENDCH